jgi:hypothetical protein
MRYQLDELTRFEKVARLLKHAPGDAYFGPSPEYDLTNDVGPADAQQLNDAKGISRLIDPPKHSHQRPIAGD